MSATKEQPTVQQSRFDAYTWPHSETTEGIPRLSSTDIADTCSIEHTLLEMIVKPLPTIRNS